MIRVTCSRCHTRFTTSNSNAGKTGRCPKCNRPLRVPALSFATVAPRPVEAAPPAAPAAAGQAAPQAGAAAQPPAAEPPRAVVVAGGEVAVGQVFRWIGQGVVAGLRNVVPLTLGLAIMLILVTLAWTLCVVPGVFLEPPLVAGFILLLLGAARGKSGLLGRLFAGFSGGRYWRTMGAIWLLGLIFAGVSVPITLAVILIGASSVMLLVEEGVIGLLVLAVALPVVYSPMVFLASRLAWALPLVVEGRARAAESLAVSWRLTGKVARGFGLFVQMLVLALGSLIVYAAMAAAVLTLLGLGGLAAVSAAGPEIIAQQEALEAVGNMSAMTGETTEAFHERSVRELYRRMGKPLPPSGPGESPDAYWYRADRELRSTMAGESLGAAGAMAAAGIVAMTAAGLAVTLLSTALGAVLAMPGIVGYRDMCRLVRPAAG